MTNCFRPRPLFVSRCHDSPISNVLKGNPAEDELSRELPKALLGEVGHRRDVTLLLSLSPSVTSGLLLPTSSLRRLPKVLILLMTVVVTSGLIVPPPRYAPRFPLIINDEGARASAPCAARCGLTTAARRH
ncbi:hypothetical protein EVAR_82611_1 [Eumeta japonica]|uniref:Uncharacterized protein n=1 Tax=Eumeta variegata TaxID=151549 RepID=A0A4C1X6I9_EUMVA|nr:hypothetical protein EVAR_82611_1 [Eumeta japonica]